MTPTSIIFCSMIYVSSGQNVFDIYAKISECKIFDILQNICKFNFRKAFAPINKFRLKWSKVITSTLEFRISVSLEKLNWFNLLKRNCCLTFPSVNSGEWDYRVFIITFIFPFIYYLLLSTSERIIIDIYFLYFTEALTSTSTGHHRVPTSFPCTIYEKGL